MTLLFEAARLWRKVNRHSIRSAEGDEKVAYERKMNQCGLFPNTAAPDKSDFNAQIDVECAHCGKVTAFWLNGWRKVTKTGGKYLSLALRPKKLGESGRTGTRPAAADLLDDF
jgi:hypothetical protein